MKYSRITNDDATRTVNQANKSKSTKIQINP